jgi:hypothetical protein
MKLVVAVILFFTIGLNNNRIQQPPAFKIATFKDVPDEMSGCGDCYYLSEKDKKQHRFICVTDFDTYLVNINGKQIRLKPDNALNHGKESVWSSGKYSLSVKDTSSKQEDTEYYVLTAVITIKYGTKVIWQQKVIGDGGC